MVQGFRKQAFTNSCICGANSETSQQTTLVRLLLSNILKQIIQEVKDENPLMQRGGIKQFKGTEESLAEIILKTRLKGLRHIWSLLQDPQRKLA
jgi:hypothetical protein